MGMTLCLACGKKFQPCAQVPQQQYCSMPACQRERRRRWQQNKRLQDPDYRDNQKRAQQAWCENHTNYWRNYRNTHAEYVERNRMQQRDRNARKGKRPVAKMDASSPVPPFQSGLYRIAEVAENGVAKKSVWIVKITVLSIA